jgi:threonine dehydratase
VCVPVGNNPEKNAAVRGLGARLVEEGRDYDESLVTAERLVREAGLHMVHSTNDATVVAGAGTLTLEMLEQAPEIDALVYSIGGGSQAVGGLTGGARATARAPGLRRAGRGCRRDPRLLARGRPLAKPSAATFADGLATRSTYALTFEALREGLAGFVTVSEAEIAEAVRLAHAATHTLVEGAGAAGLAGLLKLRDALAGKTVGIVFSGANIDRATLGRVLAGEL